MSSPRSTPSSSRQQTQATIGKDGLKILLVRPRLVHPINSNARIHTARLLEQLSRENEVTLVTCRFPEDSQEDAAATARLCTHLVTVPIAPPKKPQRKTRAGTWNLFGSLPDEITPLQSRALAQCVAGLYKRQRPETLVCDSLNACEALRYLPAVPFILLKPCIDFTLLQQRARLSTSPVQALALHWQAWRMRNYERRQCANALRVVTASDVDRTRLEHEFGTRHCEVAPVGIDTNYFQPSAVACRANNLVFTGAMDSPPNQDAMEYLVREVFPLVQHEIRSVVLSIVGCNPSPRMLQLGTQPGIHVTESAGDIRPYVHGAKVYVAPLRVSNGVQSNVLQALAMGKAVVSTPAGANGLRVQHGQNILLADSATGLAREIVSLLRDTGRREMLESNARALAENTPSWQEAARDFADIYYRAVLETHGIAP